MKRTPREPYSQKDLDKIKSLQASGATLEQMGKELGRNPKALYSKIHTLKAASKKQAQKPKQKKYIESKMPTVTKIVDDIGVAFVGKTSWVSESVKELFK